MSDSEEGVSTVRLSAPLFAQMRADVLRAYPREGCGLLLGSLVANATPHGLLYDVTEIRPSPNIAEGAGLDRFEIDPRIRFDAERQARSGGPQVIGHYHSHPNGRRTPSDTDRSLAFEAGLLWLILAVQPPTSHPAGSDCSLAAFLSMGENTDFIPLKCIVL